MHYTEECLYNSEFGQLIIAKKPFGPLCFYIVFGLDHNKDAAETEINSLDCVLIDFSIKLKLRTLERLSLITYIQEAPLKKKLV